MSVHVPAFGFASRREELDRYRARLAAARAGLRCCRSVRGAGMDAHDGRDQEQCKSYPAHGSPLLANLAGATAE